MDITEILVALIAFFGILGGTLFSYTWKSYIRPWLEERKLEEVAVVVVNAAEAILGRYAGEEKWKLALQKMAERGFDVDDEAVIEALKSAWNQMNISQIAAGVKEAEIPSRIDG